MFVCPFVPLYFQLVVYFLVDSPHNFHVTFIFTRSFDRLDVHACSRRCRFEMPPLRLGPLTISSNFTRAVNFAMSIWWTSVTKKTHTQVAIFRLELQLTARFLARHEPHSYHFFGISHRRKKARMWPNITKIVSSHSLLETLDSWCSNNMIEACKNGDIWFDFYKIVEQEPNSSLSLADSPVRCVHFQNLISCLCVENKW